jgi:probable addiction module antidote protein
MGKVATTHWDPADHLESAEDMAAYLEAALADGEPALIAAALADIGRARGMAQVAGEGSLARSTFDDLLASGGNPDLATLLKVVSALGLQLHASPADEKSAA